MDVWFWLCGLLDLGCVDVGFRLGGFWTSDVWTFDFCCVDVGFLLYRRWILIRWMLDFCCVNVGIFVVWMLDFGLMD